MTTGTAAGRKYRALLPMIASYAASGGSLVISSAAQLLTFAILARFLGVHEFSLFVAITAVANIAVHLCGLGATECLVRRVARDPQIYPVMLGHNLILITTSGLLLVILGAMVLPFFFKVADDPVANIVLITVMLATNIVLVRAILFTEQVFIAFSDFASANKAVVGFALVRTAAAGCACLLLGVSTLDGWIIWQFSAHALFLVACIKVLAPLGLPRFQLVREELRLGLFFSIPFILKAARQNADLLVLSLVTSAEIMSSYSVARRIIESSYLSVDALNRILYPGTARASMGGLHNAVGRVRRIFLAALAISITASVTVWICAPILPYLFGHEYTSLVTFVRYLCWVVVPVACWAIPLEALGAAGHQGARGAVLGGGSLMGAALAAWATWYAAPQGTLISYYVIEIAMMMAAWLTYLRTLLRSAGESYPRSGAPAE
ncbi:sugar transporter [Pseudorhizobium endolithicum]|uniref:Sugar transporter n=1 Tax=Pseudorhizobium endolithicum TaxID=1191678 RepID=A0ABN7JN65_9HYPH|nr:lipopolysaccharide biosynthesis protein [Pseudorhizobium endolithicum]CAD7039282.1 sugar transporter [Pseudorhizobium endolithicum]